MTLCGLVGMYRQRNSVFTLGYFYTEDGKFSLILNICKYTQKCRATCRATSHRIQFTRFLFKFVMCWERQHSHGNLLWSAEKDNTAMAICCEVLRRRAQPWQFVVKCWEGEHSHGNLLWSADKDSTAMAICCDVFRRMARHGHGNLFWVWPQQILPESTFFLRYLEYKISFIYFQYLHSFCNNKCRS